MLLKHNKQVHFVVKGNISSLNLAVTISNAIQRYHTWNHS